MTLLFRIGVPVMALAVGTPRHTASNHPVPHAADWQRIDTPALTCALGTPYNFWVRRGNPAHLAIYFQGGGACFNGETCDVRGTPTFDPVVDSTDDPAGRRGILDFANPLNPIADYTVVYVPYCTGDVFLGNRDVQYQVTDSVRRTTRAFTIRHRGAIAVDSVLAWTWRNVPSPQIVFVSGSSAGAIPSPLVAARAAVHYPSARVVQFGDAAGGYRGTGNSITENWGVLGALRTQPAFGRIDSSMLAVPVLYNIAARAAPRATYSQWNTVSDSIQLFFVKTSRNGDTILVNNLRNNFADIRRDIPGFRTYTAPGQYHTILLRPQFYTLEVGGVKVRDWLAELLAGRQVRDVGGELLRNGP